MLTKTLSTTEQEHLIQLTQIALDEASKLGADGSEIGASIEKGFTVNVRLGDVDTVEYNHDKAFGVTVHFGQRKGSASTSESTPDAIKQVVARACDIAKFTGEDEFSSLPDKDGLVMSYPDLDLAYPWDITPEEAIKLAIDCEAVGRKIDKRITNSEGASIAKSEAFQVCANSHGFIGSFPRSHHSVSCVYVGEENNEMQRDYYYSIARDPSELETPAEVAKKAAERTVRRLSSRRLKTCKVPVIFEAKLAANLMSSFIAAIRGGNIYRKTSFLIDHLGKQIFPEFINVFESPHLKKAIGSAPFDGEGVLTRDQHFIKDGILQSYVLSTYSARKLGMKTTGNAGGVHNLFVDANDLDFSQLLKKMGTGLFVTEVMGQGVNLLTGDYSRGAAGFWVENGEIQYPVHEITIAGNLRDMFLNIVAIASDIDRRGNFITGSMLIDEMTIAGE